MTTPEPPREQRFRSLYAETYADALRFARRRVDRSAAEDVVAEAFLVVWRRLDDAPRRPDDVRAWIFGITRHCLLNARRGAGRREALAVRLAQGASAPDVDPNLVALRLDLAASWRDLRPEQQEVLALAVFEGLTSAQAGRVLGITAVAYRLRLARARRALGRRLDPPRSDSTHLTAAEEAAR